MFCTKCGFENPEGTRFCVRCGSPIETPNAQAPQPQNTPYPAGGNAPAYVPPRAQAPNAAFAGGPYAPMYSQPVKNETVVNQIAKRGGSVLFLIATIIATIPVILSLINSLSSAGLLSYALMPALHSIGLDVAGARTLMDIAPVIIILFSLTGIISVAGLWITFISSKASHGRKLSSAGFVMIKVITIISMVLVLLVLLVGLILAVVGMIAAGSVANSFGGNYGSASTVGMIVVLVLIIGIIVFIIFYFAKLLRMLSSMISVIRKGEGKPFVSVFIMVICFIAAISSLFTFFFSLGLATSGASLFREFGISVPIRSSFMTTLPQLLNAINYVLFAIIMIKAKKETYNAKGAGAAAAPGGPAQVRPAGPAAYGAPNPYSNPVPPVMPMPGVAPMPGQMPIQNAQPAPQPAPQPTPQAAPQPASVPEVPAPEPEGSTVILNEPEPAVQPVPVLTRLNTGEFVRIEKSNFRIGKDPTNNDYTITGNSAISRQHAEIIYDGTDYYIIDHNSSNHVYIDGGLIKPELYYPIEDGVTIRLADEDFSFKLQ